MIHMKTILFGHVRPAVRLLTAVALLAIASGCIRVQTTTSDNSSSYSAGDFKVEATRTLTGQFPADLKALEVDNHFGAIRVVAVEANSGQWSWKLKTHAKTEALATEAGNAVTCQTVPEGDRVRLAVTFPDSSKYRASFESDLEIQVPKAIALRTANHFGATTISGIGGNVDATNQNGSLDLSNIGGKVRAQTSFDSLTLHGAANASLKNQNGRIEVSDIHGSLEVQTSFDTLKAQNIDGSIRARNQNGRLEVRKVKGGADLQTSFDALSAEDIDGSIRAHNQNGSLNVHRVKGKADLQTSFDSMQVEAIGDNVILANQNGQINAKGIAGSVRAGTSFDALNIETAGRKINLQNQNGSIRLHATSPEIVGIEAHTSFDKMEILLPAGLKPVIQAHTSFAEVESDYPIIPKPATPDTLAEAETDPAVPRIHLQNQNGTIRIVREKSTAAR
jgi:hypothetical protein